MSQPAYGEVGLYSNNLDFDLHGSVQFKCFFKCLLFQVLCKLYF